MELPRTARKPFEVPVTATLPDNSPATVTGASFALCGHGGPTDDTVWTPATAYNSSTGVASGVVADADADDLTGALVVSVARCELWGLPTSPQGVDPWFIETVERLG